MDKLPQYSADLKNRINLSRKMIYVLVIGNRQSAKLKMYRYDSQRIEKFVVYRYGHTITETEKSKLIKKGWVENMGDYGHWDIQGKYFWPLSGKTIDYDPATTEIPAECNIIDEHYNYIEHDKKESMSIRERWMQKGLRGKIYVCETTN